MNRNNKLQNMHELKVQLKMQLRVAFKGAKHEEKGSSSSTEGGKPSCRHSTLVLAQTAGPLKTLNHTHGLAAVQWHSRLAFQILSCILTDHSPRTPTAQPPGFLLCRCLKATPCWYLADLSSSSQELWTPRFS